MNAQIGLMLLALQRLDQRLTQLARRHYLLLTAHERARSMLHMARHLERNQLTQLRIAREQLSELSWELDDLEVQLRELEGQPRGDQSHDQEVASLRVRQNQLESDVIAQMLRTDEIDRRLPVNRQALTHLRTSLQRRMQRLEHLIQTIERQIAELDVERHTQAVLLPKNLLARYEQRRAATSNEPLTTARNGYCTACGGRLPAAADECPSCGRILI